MCVCVFFFPFCLLFRDAAFSEYIFVPFPLSVCMDYRVRRTFFPSTFLPCDHGLDFLHQLIM